MTDNAGFNPLHHAASSGNVERVRELLSGADIAATTTYTWLVNGSGMVEGYSVASEDWTALHIAADKGHEQVVGVLLEAPDGDKILEKRTKHDLTPLHLAAIKGHAAVVKLLLAGVKETTAFTWLVNGKKISSLGMKTGTAWTALHLAATWGHQEAVKELLTSEDVKAGIDAKGGSDQTALYVAAKFGHAVVVRALVIAGADRTVPSSIGNDTPLHIAAIHGFVDVVEALFAVPGLGLLNIEAKGTWRPLSLAVNIRWVEVVRVMLRQEGLDKVSFEQAMGTAVKRKKTEVSEVVRKEKEIVKMLEEYKLTASA